MPYERWNKTTRIKDRSEDGTNFSWTVASTFGGGDEKKVTLVLGNPPRNTFYQKHVLRRGEDNWDILAVRNSAKAGSYNDEQRQFGDFFDIKTSGAPASTVIDINKINFNAMLYDFANALYQARTNNKMSTLHHEYHIDVEFSQKCVSTVKSGRSEKWYKTMEIGVEVIADDGAGRMTFDVNHCGGAS